MVSLTLHIADHVPHEFGSRSMNCQYESSVLPGSECIPPFIKLKKEENSNNKFYICKWLLIYPIIFGYKFRTRTSFYLKESF